MSCNINTIKLTFNMEQRYFYLKYIVYVIIYGGPDELYELN